MAKDTVVELHFVDFKHTLKRISFNSIDQIEDVFLLTKTMAIKTEYLIQPVDVFLVACGNRSKEKPLTGIRGNGNKRKPLTGIPGNRSKGKPLTGILGNRSKGKPLTGILENRSKGKPLTGILENN